VNSWDRPETYSTSRLIAALWLLNQADEALTETHRTPGDSALAEGGRPVGRPPAPALHQDHGDSTEALLELGDLFSRRGQESGADVRRMAELCELLDQDELAHAFWERAAEMGDEDAQGYLEVLEEEEKENLPGEGTSTTSLEALLCHLLVELRRAGKGDTSPPFQAIEFRFMLKGELDRHAGNQAIRDLTLTTLAHQMIEEIEDYIANPDRITDGGRL